MYLLTNRYAIHVLVIVVAVGTGAMSVQASGLRSDDFGQDSILYDLVTGQSNSTIVIRADSIVSKPSSYLGASALVARTNNIDYHDATDEYVAIATGSAALIAPTIAESGESVAPRTEVIQYIVQPGDSVGTISESHGIYLNTLLWANNLTVRSVIKPGDSLRILPVDGVEHTVKSGDTLSSLSKKYDAEKDNIVEYNHLSDTSDLQIGETIMIPGGKVIAVAPKITTHATQVFTPPPQTSTAPANVTSSGSMMWPTDLHVITQYYGWRHTGVDIDCLFTNENYAADDGYVQFSGWKGGYGLAVEINHGNGLVTRYGHHAQLYVSAGQQVTKGTPLGICGTTGRSTGTHLHFEVIRNGKFTNPLEYVR